MRQEIETWKLILAGMCSLILTMGIARFALTPILPALQADTGMGDDAAGLLAGINYAGYLTGALLASRLKDPVIKQHWFRIAILLAVLTTIAMSWTQNMMLWCGFRYISGMTSAAGMVICTSLILDHLKERKLQDLIGVHFGGVGVGVVISALVLIWSIPAHGWSQSWMIVGLVGLVCALPCFLWIKADGLQGVKTDGPKVDVFKSKRVRALLAAYFFSGATFSIGTTFIISIMAQSPGLSDSRNIAWVMVGLALAPSCYIWVKLAGRFGDLPALTLAHLIQAIGCALPVLYPHPATAIIGGLMFGGTFMGIVSVVLSLGAKLSPHNPSCLMGILVVSYGAGQVLGPIVIGLVMEQTGMSALGLWSAALCSLISIGLLALMAAFQKTAEPTEDLPAQGARNAS